MIKNKMINAIVEHIHENFWLYIITLLCTCIGIVLGIYTVGYMDASDKNELIKVINDFTLNISAYDIDHKAIFLESLKNNIPLIAAIWFLGLTMVGIPVILIADVLKGFTIGFAVSFMINSLGFKGIWVSILGIMPQNFIYIPCIIISSVLALEYSLMLIKNKGTKVYFSKNTMNAGIYSIAFLFIIVVMSVGFLIEIYITPGLMKIIVASLGSDLA